MEKNTAERKTMAAEEEDGLVVHQQEHQHEEMYRFEYADNLNQPFLCFICLELVHKPVVNACGHMFCFWCIHHAMNVETESYCPLCRRPYMHFPRVCEQLHFLLLKAVPDAYRRRCREVYEEEACQSLFSPQFNDGLDFDGSGEVSTDVPSESAPVGASAAPTELVLPEDVNESVLPENVNDDKVSPIEVQDHIAKGKLLDSSSSSSSLETDSDLNSRQAAGESIDIAEGGIPSSSPYVMVCDLLCTSCKKLLYRPVVVNCGHLFCEGCLTVDEAGDATLKCSTCGSAHPGAFPQVCLELHQYLEQNFSTEYARRKMELSTPSGEHQKTRNTLNKDLQASDICKEVKQSTPRPQHSRMHPRIGCDGCGMYPMLGRRFKCVECPKLPGYDLCFNCYQNGTNLVGRFNQQHLRHHRMRELVGNSSPFDLDYEDAGETSDGMETYFGIVGYFA